MIYLDNNATTRVDKRVIDVMLPFFYEEYGNPSSDHARGVKAKAAVDKARNDIAKIIRAKTDEIIFSGGATESNNLALFGIAGKEKDSGKKHLIISNIEHPAILEPAKYLESIGYKVTRVSVNSEGIVNVSEIENNITSQTLLISIMTANNETGVIQPVQDIGKLARKHGVLFHTDAAQAIGHTPIDVDDMCIDLLSVSAHKFGGPKGIGCLFVRNRIPRVKLSPVNYGGGQERGIRPGTLNVPGIVGMAEACKIASVEMKGRNELYKNLISKLYSKLKKKRNDIRINGHQSNRLAHTLNLEIPGIDNKWLTLKLKEFCISTGSACSSTHDEPSHVLIAMGLSKKQASCSIRIGLGLDTNEADIDSFLSAVLSLI